MFLVCLSLLIASALAFDSTFKTLPVTEEEHADAFEFLMTQHGREYGNDAALRAEKYATFKTNVKHIEELRVREPRARFAPNLFFDMSKAEFAQYRMKPKNLKEEAKLAAHKQAAGVTVVPSCLADGVEKKRAAPVAAKKPKAVPSQFDWGTHNPPVVSPVKNQAACGSCWAFSATETLESAWAIKTGKLPILAPQQIVDCSTTCSNEGNPPQPVCDQGCDGGWPWGAVATLMQEGGQDTEASYPYQGVDGTCAFTKANVAAVPKNYTCISGPDLATDAEMQAALIQYGPLSIACDASEWQFYYDGIISQNFLCSQESLDHAIQITAYLTISDLFGYATPVWKVRNSWSSSWGESGYLYLTRGENTCGVNSAVTAVNV